MEQVWECWLLLNQQKQDAKDSTANLKSGYLKVRFLGSSES
jgi:hypothetical protein